MHCLTNSFALHNMPTNLYRYWKAGNVDYKKIPALQGLDLSCYRGKAREEVRVS